MHTHMRGARIRCIARQSILGRRGATLLGGRNAYKAVNADFTKDEIGRANPPAAYNLAFLSRVVLLRIAIATATSRWRSPCGVSGSDG